MKAISSTPRLDGILSLLDSNDALCEIGADRAPIAVAFALKFNMPCFASEYGEGPFSALKDSIASKGLENLITTYQAEGLNYLPDAVNTICVCGMGGVTIGDILKENPHALKKLKKLILEPQSEAEEARKTVLGLGFKIIKDFYVVERHRLYPVILAVPGNDKPYERFELEYGRLTFENHDPNLYKLLEKQLQSLKSLSVNRQIEEKKAYIEGLLAKF